MSLTYVKKEPSRQETQISRTGPSDLAMQGIVSSCPWFPGATAEGGPVGRETHTRVKLLGDAQQKPNHLVNALEKLEQDVSALQGMSDAHRATLRRRAIQHSLSGLRSALVSLKDSDSTSSTRSVCVQTCARNAFAADGGNRTVILLWTI